jgi:hypothetical protein
MKIKLAVLFVAVLYLAGSLRAGEPLTVLPIPKPQTVIYAAINFSNPWSAPQTFPQLTITGAAGGKCIHTDPVTRYFAETSADCGTGTGGGGVTAVTATAPITSSGGASPNIACNVATGTTSGCLAAADFSTFAAKQTPIGSFTAPSHQFFSGFTAPSTFVSTQPGFTDLTGVIGVSQTPLTTSQDILYNNGGVLARLPIVNPGACLGNVSGTWNSISCGGSGGGGITSITTTAPITGGPITSTGTIACATCTTASAPAAGIANFPGASQALSSGNLSGDVTSTSLATTVTRINGVTPGGTCTLQAVTAINSSAVPTCSTITSAFTTGTFPPAAHNFLSASHGDTTPASPVLGDVIYASGTPAWTRLPGNTLNAKRFLNQTGTGTVSAVPNWGIIAITDLPAGISGTGACAANNFASTLNSLAAPTCTPAIVASAGPAHQFATAISAAGVLSYAQPSFADVSGIVAIGQTPLTTQGDLLTVNSTPALARIGIGLSGQCLTSTGTSVTWSACSTGTVTTTGSPLAGNLTQFSSPTSITNGNLSGDATTSGSLSVTVSKINGITPGGTCTNQAVTALTNSAVPTCTTLTSAYTSGTFPASGHNLLSSTHTDTVAAAPVLGDILYGNSTPAWTKLPGNTSSTKQFLTQTGTSAVSAAPSWGAITITDLPSGVGGTGTCAANNFVNSINNVSSPTCAPAVIASAGAAHQFATAISAAGALTYAQPAFADVSGSIALAQTPLTTVGDLLTVGAGPALSRLAIGSNGQCLTSTGTAASWGSCAAGGTVTVAPPTAANGNLTKFSGSTTITNGDLSGDATTSGTLVTTVSKINGITPGGTCTNQVVTSLTTSAVPTCTTVTSAYTSGTFPGTPHNLLSSTHPDTLAASPVLGDILYANGTPSWTKLSGSISATRQFLTQTGTGLVSAGPAWATILPTDIPVGGTVTGAMQYRTSTAILGGDDLIKTDTSGNLTANSFTSNGTCAAGGTAGCATFNQGTLATTGTASKTILYGGTDDAYVSIGANAPQHLLNAGTLTGGKCLQTTGTAGAVSEAAAACSTGGATTPGGASGSIQYNSSGTFGGDNGITTDGNGNLSAVSLNGVINVASDSPGVAYAGGGTISLTIGSNVATVASGSWSKSNIGSIITYTGGSTPNFRVVVIGVTGSPVTSLTLSGIYPDTTFGAPVAVSSFSFTGNDTCARIQASQANHQGSLLDATSFGASTPQTCGVNPLLHGASQTGGALRLAGNTTYNLTRTWQIPGNFKVEGPGKHAGVANPVLQAVSSVPGFNATYNAVAVSSTSITTTKGTAAFQDSTAGNFFSRTITALVCGAGGTGQAYLTLSGALTGLVEGENISLSGFLTADKYWNSSWEITGVSGNNVAISLANTTCSASPTLSASTLASVAVSGVIQAQFAAPVAGTISTTTTIGNFDQTVTKTSAGTNDFIADDAGSCSIYCTGAGCGTDAGPFPIVAVNSATVVTIHTLPLRTPPSWTAQTYNKICSVQGAITALDSVSPSNKVATSGPMQYTIAPGTTVVYNIAQPVVSVEPLAGNSSIQGSQIVGVGISCGSIAGSVGLQWSNAQEVSFGQMISVESCGSYGYEVEANGGHSYLVNLLDATSMVPGSPVGGTGYVAATSTCFGVNSNSFWGINSCTCIDPRSYVSYDVSGTSGTFANLHAESPAIGLRIAANSNNVNGTAGSHGQVFRAIDMGFGVWDSVLVTALPVNSDVNLAGVFSSNLPGHDLIEDRTMNATCQSGTTDVTGNGVSNPAAAFYMVGSSNNGAATRTRITSDALISPCWSSQASGVYAPTYTAGYTNGTTITPGTNASPVTLTLPNTTATMLAASTITGGKCLQSSGTAGVVVEASGACGTSTGTVSSIATTGPISGGTITTTGTISCPTCAVTPLALSSLATQAANTLVMNATGSTAVPTAVAMPACADSAGNHLNYSAGTFTCGTTASVAGTVTSVGLAGTANQITVTGTSPITSSGSWTLALAGAFGSNPTATGQVHNSTGANAASWSATPTLGASGTAGTLAFGNATSGTVTLGTVTGALGSVTASLPANTGTIAELNLAQSWAATQTFGTNISIGGVTPTGATGTGNIVFATSPTLTTPTLGAATATTLNGLTVTSSTGTLTVANGKTLTATNTMDVAKTAGVAGALPYFDTTTSMSASSAGTAKQVVLSGGAGAPTMIDFPQMIDIIAANCNNATGGAGWSIGSGGTVTCRAGTNNLGGYITITTTAATFAQFMVDIPLDWDTATNPYIRFKFSAATDTTNGHTVIPQIKVSCPTAGGGTVSDDATFSAAQSSSTVTIGASAVANGFYNTSNVQIGSTQMTGCFAGGMMIVQVGRATDTATGNINFYSATLTFPRLVTVQAN